MAVIERHWWKALLAVLVIIAGTILITTYHPSAKAHADTGDTAQPGALPIRSPGFGEEKRACCERANWYRAKGYDERTKL